jgi:serine/threonine-protein kinase
VALVVSIAPRVAVPNVVGILLADATDELDPLGLVLAVADKEESDSPEGSILSQTPAEGTRVDRGTTLSVTIAVARPKLTTVPNLVGKTVDDAKAALTTAQLVLDVTGQRPVPGTPSGMVLDQDPQSGASVVVGSQVHVNVSEVDPTVEVPDIRKQTIPKEQAIHNQNNHQIAQRTTQTSVLPAGIVLSQDTVPGSRAPTGSTVTVVVSAGGLVVVPALIGRTQAVASGMLRAVGLNMSATVETNLSRPPGTIFEQDPDAGAQVPVGSTVDVVSATRAIVDPGDGGPIVRKPGSGPILPP